MKYYLPTKKRKTYHLPFFVGNLLVIFLILNQMFQLTYVFFDIFI